MDKKRSLSLLKQILQIIVIALIGCVGIVFSILYLQTFNSGFFAKYNTVCIAVAVSIIAILTILAIIFKSISKDFIYKLCFLVITFVAVVLLGLYILTKVGFFEVIDSVETLRAYIESFGSWAVVLFILLQFLQVVVLPIPAFLTVGAGVLLFGAFEGAIYSCIGIITGSIVGFFIGRVFGYKVARWLVGKESLDKGLETIKGKDKVVLTFMFLFPFFPDDVLCFVAGLTTVKTKFFLIMIFITRIISIFASCFSLNNSIIPYDTWWGILLWGVFIALTIVATILIYKKGDKIELFFKRLFKLKKKSVNKK